MRGVRADFKRSLSAQLAASIFNVSLRLAGFAKYKKTWLIAILYTCTYVHAPCADCFTKLSFCLVRSQWAQTPLSPVRCLSVYVPVMPISDTWQSHSPHAKSKPYHYQSWLPQFSWLGLPPFFANALMLSLAIVDLKNICIFSHNVGVGNEQRKRKFELFCQKIGNFLKQI